ncbi:UNVERIFIED_CONTAM: hypothetical protein FKN15_059927 [Acipenser sinensis]
MAFIVKLFCGVIKSDSKFCDAARDHGLNPKPFYKLDVSWPNLPELFTGQVFAVAVNPVNGVIYVAQRGDNVPKILVFTREGYFLQAWNTSSIEMPHGIFIANASSNPSVWITDVGNDLEVVWMHGEKGTGPAQFYIPHSVAVDSFERVWVADRGNKRIQAFNAVTGDWLGSWSSCFDNAPYSVRLTPDQKYFIVAQLNINQITILEAPPVGAIGSCKIVSVIQLGEDVKPHLVELDLKTGDLYVAEIGAQ